MSLLLFFLLFLGVTFECPTDGDCLVCTRAGCFYSSLGCTTSPPTNTSYIPPAGRCDDPPPPTLTPTTTTTVTTQSPPPQTNNSTWTIISVTVVITATIVMVVVVFIYRVKRTVTRRRLHPRPIPYRRFLDNLEEDETELCAQEAVTALNSAIDTNRVEVGRGTGH